MFLYAAYIWWLVGQKQVSKAGTINLTPQYLRFGYTYSYTPAVLYSISDTHISYSPSVSYNISDTHISYTTAV